jgi:hypothetical protein
MSYNGIVFLTDPGASGDFLVNFTDVCSYTLDTVTQRSFRSGWTLTKNKIYSSSNRWSNGYRGELEKFVPIADENIRDKFSANKWENISLEDINLETYFKYFKKDTSRSLINTHTTYINDHINRKDIFDKFFTILKLFNKHNIKLYYIDYKLELTSLYTLYVESNTMYTSNVDLTNIKENFEKTEKSILKSDRLLNHKIILDELNKQKINFEIIDLDNLLFNRDFDGLYDQMSKSWKLVQKLSDENKKITNELWDDRISHLKKLDWW